MALWVLALVPWSGLALLEALLSLRVFALCRADGRDKGVRRRPGIGLTVYEAGRLVVGSVSVAWKPAGHVGSALSGGV